MANVGSVEEVRDNAAELGQDPAASIDTTPTPDLTPERDIVGGEVHAATNPGRVVPAGHPITDIGRGGHGRGEGSAGCTPGVTVEPGRCSLHMRHGLSGGPPVMLTTRINHG
jgi:hypothetical protein